MNRKWTDSDKQFVQMNAEVFTDKQVAEKLGRIKGEKISLHAIRKLRQSLGLKKAPGRGVCKVVATPPTHHI